MGISKFVGYGWFCYDPATAESDDLVLMLTCAPADRGWFRNEEGDLLFPQARGCDAVKFEIERGTGLVLAALEPVLLPDNDEWGGFEEAVLHYAARACAFISANTDLILDALRTPYRA